MNKSPPKLLTRFVKIGLLDRSRAAAGKALAEHLQDFRQSMLAKGTTDRQARLVTGRAAKIIGALAFHVWSDIRADRVERYLADRRSSDKRFSVQTSNFYLQAMKGFCRWMVVNRRATENPLAHLAPLNVKIDRRHDRCALEVDEVRKLLAAAAVGPERYGVDGRERVIVTAWEG